MAGTLYSALPGLGTEMLAWVNRALPDSRNSEKEPGWKNESFVSRSFLTKLGRDAARRYNEQVPA
jgi:hypothetical protein